MRFTAFVLLATCLHVAAKGRSQTVSLTMRNAPVQKVFREIIRQTGVSIVYDEALFAGTKPVSLQVRNASLSQVMTKCLEGSPFAFEVEGNMIVLKKVTPPSTEKNIEDIPPPIEIRGRVTDDSGDPIEGVSVRIKGKNTGSTTDKDGRFLVNAESDDVLEISFVGFSTKEIAVKNQTLINTTLVKSESKMDEVVVIGYGTQKKRDLTGAVGMISRKSMENNAVASIGHAMQGKVAGLSIRQSDGSPGAGVDIKIRGLGTFGASGNPLVVIDGIITTTGLNDIDPSNIEDISILKDASSAAIYGSRGANGVILVTTKRGRTGKALIDVESYYSIDNVIKKIETVDAATYGQMVNEYYTNQGKPAPFDNPASFGKGTNWQDEIFRTGGKQNYALSVTGGTEKNLYALTMSYYQGMGTVVNSKYNRGNFRINNDFKPIKNLKMGSSLGLTYGVSNFGDPQGAIWNALIYAPTVKAYNDDGTYGIANRQGEPTTMAQPLVLAYERSNREIKIRGLGNVYAEYQILKGLTFRSSVGVDFNNYNGKFFTPSYDFGLGNSNGTASIDRQSNYTMNWMIDNLLTYNTVFGANHGLDVMVGYTFQDEKYEFLNGQRNGFPRNDENLQVINAGTANDQVQGSYTEWAIQSVLGRLNYAYKGKYLFNSNVRVDQSSRFKKSNRTSVFPSFSAGWVISEEDAFKDNLGPVSFLKLRAGFGSLGNSDIGSNYPYQSFINSNLYYDFGKDQSVYAGAAPTALANETIRWEKTQTTSVGVEANFFNDKLRFIADYFERLTTDVLVQIPLPTLAGLSQFPFQNAGSVRNNGVEFTADYRNSINKDFSYNIGFNVSFNKNKVTRLAKGNELIYFDARTAEGHAIVEFYGYVHDGIFQTADDIAKAATQPNAAPGDIRFKDLNNDGVINTEDRTYLGSNFAKQILGINGGVRYKNFDFIFTLNGDFGRDRVIRESGFALTRGAEQTNGMFYDRWTGPGTSNWVPRLVGGDPNSNSRFSNFWLSSQDYLRIQNVQLGYDFSSKMIKRAGLRQLRLYVAAQNLATFTDFAGFDPDLNATTYPISRSFFFGANIGLN